MSALNYNPNHKAVIDGFLLGLPGISESKIFGLHCYKIDNTVFATYYGDSIGIKLPEYRVQELLNQPDFDRFQPFGRDRGAQFVQISHQDSEEYLKDKALFLESMAYVASSGKPAKKSSKAAKPKSTEAARDESYFREIAESLASKYCDVTWGKMMSSPGIRYKDKFFAFYYDKCMVVRFGRDFRPESLGIHQYSLLSPFKTKPPLVDWFCIAAADQERWEEAANVALKIMAGK